MAKVRIPDIRHPLYELFYDSWRKWRLTFEAGDEFIRVYLKQYSKNETNEEFKMRREITYCPAFAKAAVIEVRNSIYQRLSDITRAGGSKSYRDAVIGKEGGVDLLGSSMNTFMGVEVLEELLVMSRVGVYVDMPQKRGETMATNQGIRPYLYCYKVEDIRSWDDDESSSPNEYRAVLLRDRLYEKDDELQLPCSSYTIRYRYYWKDAHNQIFVQFYDADGNETGPTIHLEGITRIPFVTLDLNSSLMTDICNYQIALLNLASTDMAYATSANFPFYTEQYNELADPQYTKNQGAVTVDNLTGGVIETPKSNTDGSTEVKVGVNRGRRYPSKLDRPGFISPSTEPMQVSMEKQEQLKLDIRLLINLAIANIQPKMASAESKKVDVRGLESGLSYVGLVMEDGERRIADIWHEYENVSSIDREVKYPDKYSLRNQADVFEEIDQLKKNMTSTPSIGYKRTLAKRIAELLIGQRVTPDELRKIYKEIDNADVVDVLIEKLEKDVELGYLSRALAAKLRGYPEKDLAVADEEHIARIKAIQVAQAPEGGAGKTLEENNPAARGNPDTAADPKQDVKKEKAAAGNPVRGKINKEKE